MPEEHSEVQVRKWDANPRPPARTVCGGCLRSVELEDRGSSDDQAPQSIECPHCGWLLDGMADSGLLSDLDLNRTPPGNVISPDVSGSGPTVDWAETWNRGTLGVIGRFQLRERLGEGGFGQVYLAFDPRLDRDVAVKILKHQNPSERVMQRFFREARAAARLDHANIVAVFDAGFENGRCWIVYQYISGRPLWWYRNHHPIDPPTTAKIIRDLADALDHAHHLGVLHRDLKPANVIMDDHGRPRLTDFGLARRADLDSSLTREGAAVGTPAYMSPEQAQGNSKIIDERSDIYSLGIIFYELLHGHRPREMDDLESEVPPVSETAITRVGRTLRRTKEDRPVVPPSLQKICDKAIAPSADQRYPNARALAEDLDRWLFEDRARSAKPKRVRKSALLAMSSLVLACAGLAALLSPLRHRDVPTLEPQGLVSSDAVTPAPLPKPGNTAKPVPAEEVSTAPRVEEKLEVSLMASRGSSIYHKADSSCLNQTPPQNRIPIESEEAARKEGFRRCKRCFRE